MSDKERLVLKTKESLYDPIEIEIDGQVYLSVKTTNAVLTEISKLDDELGKKNKEEEDAAVVYKIVRLLFNIEFKILELLDRREVQDIYTFAKKKFLEIEKERMDLISKTFGSIWGPDKQKVRATVPNEKRSGNKQ